MSECETCAKLSPEMERVVARSAAQMGWKMACRECGRIYDRQPDSDRITALIAAGDRLAGFADHYNECDWADRERCECGLTEALKAWRELTND